VAVEPVASEPKASGEMEGKTAKLAVVAVLAVLAALTQEPLGSPCRPGRLKRFQDHQPRPPACYLGGLGGLALGAHPAAGITEGLRWRWSR
jgi:hypothetical protein